MGDLSTQTKLTQILNQDASVYAAGVSLLALDTTIYNAGVSLLAADTTVYNAGVSLLSNNASILAACLRQGPGSTKPTLFCTGVPGETIYSWSLPSNIFWAHFINTGNSGYSVKLLPASNPSTFGIDVWPTVAAGSDKALDLKGPFDLSTLKLAVHPSCSGNTLCAWLQLAAGT
jgi:hypothetical protein